jgi:hypothetical protein
MAGDTNDNFITGIATDKFIPVIVLQSIGVGGKIYWAKAFS